MGDFDTAPCPAQEGGDTIILPHVKDDTDTEYAAKLASEKGFDEALLLGVLGGRRSSIRWPTSAPASASNSGAFAPRFWTSAAASPS